MAANDGRPNLTISDVYFSVNTGNAIKIFDPGGLKVTQAAPEKHIINFFWPYVDFVTNNLNNSYDSLDIV